MSLPKTLQRYAARIAEYSDERGSDNGIWLYYRAGWKSASDPMGCQHQDHEDTVQELAVCARDAVRCDCDDCKRQMIRERAEREFCKAFTPNRYGEYA